ncbi:MAG: hypothetical protein U1E76_02920 [Planctomycetota bacterium]
MDTTKTNDRKEVQKLETAELKSVTGGVGPIPSVPEMKRFHKHVPNRNRGLKGRK